MTQPIRYLVAIALVTTGLVAGGAQRVSGSVIASVAITSPEAGASVYGDVNVSAQAYGQQFDPPQKIEFFVDKHKRPAATVDCLFNPTYPSSSCGAQWLWHASRLFGRHRLSAKVVLLDGTLSERSQWVHVTVTAQTHLAVRRAKHPVAGRMMAVAGRVRSSTKGRPGARHLPVTVTIAPVYGGARTLHLRTNKHGVYRKKIRAVSNTTITVQTTATRKYFQSETSYVQPVRGRPRCGLSRRRAHLKKPVILKCHLSHLGISSRYVVQNRIHGKWRKGRAFYTTRPNHTKIFITPLKRRTLVMREVFPTSSVYARSASNAVRLHVT
jgi:hypothetical protein